MEPDLLSKHLSACPRCGAGVRADAPWCTQCFLNLRTPPPAPEAPPAAYPPPPPVQRLPRVPVPDPLTAPLHVLTADTAPPAVGPVDEPAAPAARTWPCTACGTPNAFVLDACSGCGQGFLASVASGPVLLVPGVGDLAAMSKAKRMGLAAAVAFGLMALVLLVGLLLA